MRTKAQEKRRRQRKRGFKFNFVVTREQLDAIQEYCAAYNSHVNYYVYRPSQVITELSKKLPK